MVYTVQCTVYPDRRTAVSTAAQEGNIQGGDIYGRGGIYTGGGECTGEGGS